MEKAGVRKVHFSMLSLRCLSDFLASYQVDTWMRRFGIHRHVDRREDTRESMSYCYRQRPRRGCPAILPLGIHALIIILSPECGLY